MICIPCKVIIVLLAELAQISCVEPPSIERAFASVEEIVAEVEQQTQCMRRINAIGYGALVAVDMQEVVTLTYVLPRVMNMAEPRVPTLDDIDAILREGR